MGKNNKNEKRGSINGVSFKTPQIPPFPSSCCQNTTLDSLPPSLSPKSQSQWPIAIFLEGLSRYPLIFSHRSLFQFLVITPFLYSYLCVCVYVNSGFDFCGVFFSLVVYDGTGNTEASQWTRSLSFSLISWVSVCIYVFVFVGVWIYYYFVFV